MTQVLTVVQIIYLVVLTHWLFHSYKTNKELRTLMKEIREEERK